MAAAMEEARRMLARATTDSEGYVRVARTDMGLLLDLIDAQSDALDAFKARERARQQPRFAERMRSTTP